MLSLIALPYMHTCILSPDEIPPLLHKQGSYHCLLGGGPSLCVGDHPLIHFDPLTTPKNSGPLTNRRPSPSKK